MDSYLDSELHIINKRIMMKNTIILFAALVLLWSCDNDFDPSVSEGYASNGEADFTTYVALGNSLTAGYADGALYMSGQQNSYPAMMAGQMALAGGGDFTQPLMPDDIGGFSNFGINGKFVLAVDNNGNLGPVQTPSASPFTPANGLYNNTGVPGAKSFHLVYPGYGDMAGLAVQPQTANPYFVRMASAPTTTVLGDAMAQNPTFFSLWIGNNDVLGYATNGGDEMLDQITPTAMFEQAYSLMVQTLVSQGAKGVLANLPYVTSIPYFTTVPYNPLSAEALGQGNATAGIGLINDVNTNLYGPLVQVLTALGEEDRVSLLSTSESNPVLINDESLTNLSAQITFAAQASGDPMLMALAPILGAQFGQARMAKPNDLVCLPTSSVIGEVNMDRITQLMGMGLDQATAASLSVNGVTLPLEDRHVLTSVEVAECTEATDAYNNIIANLANSFDLAFYDASSDMMSLSSNSGLVFNGEAYDATFVTGGAFSLDGVHPNARGYAIIANGFMESINQKYGSSLPMINPNNYPGVMFPN